MDCEVIQLNDREVYYYEYNYTKEHGASFLIMSQLIDVTGDVNRENLIKIASNIFIEN